MIANVRSISGELYSARGPPGWPVRHGERVVGPPVPFAFENPAGESTLSYAKSEARGGGRLRQGYGERRRSEATARAPRAVNLEHQR